VKALRAAFLALTLLALAADAAAAEGEPVIVAFGDSLTAGYGVAREEAYPARLAERLRRQGYPHRVVDAGVSGDTSAGGLRRVEWALRLRPAVVIVELGANDALRGQELRTTRANLEAIVRRFRAAGARVLLVGMRIPPNYGVRYAGEFRDLYPAVARATGVPLMPFFLDGVAGDPRLNLPDGIHPTGEGYGIVVERLWPHLAPLLAR
jgi:acyl-CoA thioesterase-1